ncbi:MAG TPA: hypothetical protein IGS31_04195, partial [Oscillatoriales cyanobacterium M4454_W2019_049]|nr:hypothetical protein [Oscillatoriales cyanobacterium M4454_W2019_049]
MTDNVKLLYISIEPLVKLVKSKLEFYNSGKAFDRNAAEVGAFIPKILSRSNIETRPDRWRQPRSLHICPSYPEDPRQVTMQQPDVEKIRSASDLETAKLEDPQIELAPDLETPQPKEEDARWVPKPSSNPLSWSLLFLVAIVIFAGMGIGAFLWLIAMPPAPECEEISNLSSDRDRLSCAQIAAQSEDPEKLVEAIELVGSWTEGHPLYKESQSLAAQWSRALVKQARKKVEADDLETAVALLEDVPPSNPEYENVQAHLSDWQQSWQQGRAIWKEIETALKAKEWTQAALSADKLTELPDEYWRVERFSESIERIAAEKQGWRQLALAEKAAKRETPKDYREAVRLASRIDAKAFARAEAKPKVEAWSQVLLAKATELKQTGDLDGAIDLAEAIPEDVEVRDSARQLIQLTRAQRLVESGLDYDSKLSERIWTLVNALAVGAQLNADSLFYEDTQARMPEWQTYLQDLVQLQMASSIARLGLHPTLQVAIDQAKVIGKDRPSRIYAQTLVAHWNKEVEALDNRPYLARARQLAALKTKKGYEAAIAQASAIALGEPLRNEAQTIVADSRNQIQILEDRPILEEAQKLAKKEKYEEAIEKASKIESDRALYEQAQASIKTWMETQDQKVIDEAVALAEKGKLTDAISTANQLGVGRPLYREAQRKIADWLIARDGPPVRTPAPAPAPTYYEPAPSYQEPAYYEPAPSYQEPA